MISSQEPSNLLMSIKDELALHHRDRKTLLADCVQERLTKSLTNYYDSLNKSFSYLSSKEASKLIKKV